MLWINFLHFYQPANIEPEKIIEALEKSYKKIINRLEKSPRAVFTANISGCLLLRLNETPEGASFIRRVRRLVREGRLELTGSAAYHALLPLVKEEIIIEQLEENKKILANLFGADLKIRGFFFPEMAYGPQAASAIKKLGYDWIILDEISGRGTLGAADCGRVYQDKTSGLKVIFRQRNFSSSYVPEFIADKISQAKQETIVTASDAELYGLRHKDHRNQLKTVLNSPRIKTQSVSSFLDSRPEKPSPIDLIPSSWESTEEELAAGLPYALWDNNDIIHKQLWRLARLAENLYLTHKDKAESYWAGWHLFRGLASCTFWWASGKDFRSVMGPVAWNPDETEKGVNELIRSIRSLEKFTDLEYKLVAERLALDIKKSVWEKHWQFYN